MFFVNLCCGLCYFSSLVMCRIWYLESLIASSWNILNLKIVCGD